MTLSRAFRFISAATLLPLAFALTGRVAAGQMTAAGPIHIHSCTLLQAERGRRWWAPWGPATHAEPFADGIEIVYENDGPVAANRVAFLVSYRGDVEHIVDVGTFSPSARIDHTFGNFSGDAYLGPNPNRCVVRAARFSNGTVWRSGAP